MYSPAVGNPDYYHDTITGVACSADGRWVVGNYLDDAVYLFSLDGNDAPPAAAEPPAPVGRSLRRARRSMHAEGGTFSDVFAVPSCSIVITLELVLIK